MKLGRADRDLVGLTVLALLSAQPSHPYELHRFIVDTHKDYITGLPRSLYHAVDRLVHDELITPVGVSREGRRPERTVYELTDEGRSELSSRLRRLLQVPDHDTRVFNAAVSLMGCLPPPEAERCLRARAATLEGIIVSAGAHLAALADAGLPRVVALELELEKTLRTTELEWVRTITDELGSAAISWSSPLKADLLPQLAEGATE